MAACPRNRPGNHLSNHHRSKSSGYGQGVAQSDNNNGSSRRKHRRHRPRELTAVIFDHLCSSSRSANTALPPTSGALGLVGTPARPRYCLPRLG